MLAISRVNAFLRQHQSLHRPSFDQMRLNNLRHIRGADMPVPDRVGVDDHIGPMLALVQAARRIDPDAILQPGRANRLVQQLVQLRFSVRITTGPGASRFAPVGTDKKVPLIFGQEYHSSKSIAFSHHKASDGATMKGMNSDNLHALKDDMIAFVEGHGMRHFPALIPEDTPRVWWHDAGPIESRGDMHETSKEGWKDFVEMAKAVGASMVLIGEDSVDKATLDLLATELEEVSSPNAFGPEMEKLDALFRQVGKIGHLELAFAHQGILFVHESVTQWYRSYREMVDTIEDLQDLLETAYGVDEDEEHA